MKKIFIISLIVIFSAAAAFPAPALADISITVSPAESPAAQPSAPPSVPPSAPPSAPASAPSTPAENFDDLLKQIDQAKGEDPNKKSETKPAEKSTSSDKKTEPAAKAASSDKPAPKDKPEASDKPSGEDISKMKDCLTNMRVINGALEMYLMDKGDFKNSYDVEADFLKGGYLKKNLYCPLGGKTAYKVTKKDGKDEYIIKCPAHGKTLDQLFAELKSR